ncbi:MAG: rhamnulose-1-phosphate aldolase [Emcibacteraceae bacterium]|nr:rhamnulose-1-phosphate aldolase [Emcibacteraceae bacterium]
MSDKMSDEFENLLALDDFAEICEWLAFKGWSEAEGGNLSLRIEEADVPQGLRTSNADPVELPLTLKALGDAYLLISGSGTRSRDISHTPEDGIGLYKIANDGKSYQWIAGNNKPTSEMPSHCAIQNEFLVSRPEFKAIVHTHPPRLIALTHIAEFACPKALSDTILGLQSEARIQLPEGISHLPFQVPGSLELGILSAEEIKYRNIVLWHMHGALAIGSSLSHAFDQLEVVEKASEIYWTLKQAGLPTDGMSQQDLLQSMEFFGRTDRYKNAFNDKK